MSTVGSIANPVILQSGTPLRDLSSAEVSDLAKTTQGINNSARTTPTKQVGKIQETSRTPRTTPEDLAQKTSQESQTSRVTPEEDKVTISETARAARNPEPVPIGDTVGNLNVGHKLTIKA